MDEEMFSVMAWSMPDFDTGDVMPYVASVEREYLYPLISYPALAPILISSEMLHSAPVDMRPVALPLPASIDRPEDFSLKFL